MQRFATALLATGALLACASPQEPDWLQTLRAREATPLPQQRIESSDRFFRAQAPARLAGAVRREGETYRFSLDVGSTAPVDCWVYREGIDFAGSLASLSEETFKAIAQQFGEIEARGIDRVDAGAIGESPYLAIDWMYRVTTEAGPQVGQVKHLVTGKGGRGVYCQHNEVGYAQTFRRTIGALLTSLAYESPSGAEPHFVEISTMSLKGMRVGVQLTLLTRDEVGDVRIDSRTSLLLPVTSDALQASDTFAVEFARPDGTLINQVHVETANGELVSNLHLDPQPGGAWAVEGTFQGKPLSARIEATSRPSSWLGEAFALRKTLAAGGRGARISTTRWIPEADPTRLLDGTLSIGDPVGSQGFAARLATAGLEADLVVDRQGTVAAGKIDMGVASMDVERVFLGGTF